MAKFSVGREDDSEGPSSPRRKKQRTTSCSRPPQQQQEEEHPIETHEHQLVEYEVEEVESEHDVEEELEEEEREFGDAVVEREEEEEEGGDEEGANTGQVSNGGRDLAGPSGDGSISVTLTDPDVLDCPICLEPLCSPVFQCENGHVACSSCCIKLGNKCPSCSWPIGYNRCRAIEKVIESVKVSCLNMKYGCKETVSYNKKHDHEVMCVYVPCSCPLSECNFVGSSKDLFIHFSSMHSYCAKRFQYNCLLPVDVGLEQRYLILQEQNDRTIFILNNRNELLGNVVSVSCIGPSSSERGYAYDIIARKEGSSVRLQSFTESKPRWVEHLPQMQFLLVPRDFLGSSGMLKLELCIRRHHNDPARNLRGELRCLR